MSNCFVIRARNVTETHGMGLMGLYGDKLAIEIARELLDAGKFEIAQGGNKLPRCDDTESVFDAMNMSEESHMSVGDVIVWNTGKRELCLKQGWATI